MLICIPIKERKTAQIIKSLKKAQEIGDIIEIWPETAEHLPKLKQYISKPILYKASGDEDLSEIFKIPKVDYLDLDISTPKKFIGKIKSEHPKVKIVISFHDFKKTPPKKELQKIVQKMLKNGADIVKIATTAKKFEDGLEILDLLNELTAKNISAICLAMGKEGKFTRVAGQFLGNYLMYAPLRLGQSTAPGQITAKELLCLLK